MAIDSFLDFSKGVQATIKGESQDEKFKDTFHVKTFTFAVNQKGTASTGTGVGAGKAEFDDFEFTIDTQIGSSELMKHCAIGTHFDTVILHVRKAGGKSMEFLRYVFGACIISSYSTSGDEESTDTVKFNYRSVATKYIAQKDTGAAGTPGRICGYDLKKNQEWDGGANFAGM